MSHTNSTTHYSLPQFVGTDTPGWLTDVNSAMSSIDSAIFARQQESVSNSDAITANTADINGLKTRMDGAETSITQTAQTLSDQSAAISTLQTSVTQNTGDIAGLATRVTNLSGTDVSYDPAGTNLTATTVQAAVTEVNSKITNFVFDTLWTNADPNSQIGAFNAEFNYDGYKLIMIEVQAAAGTQNARYYTETFVPELNKACFLSCGAPLISGDTQSSRIFKFTATGISFENGRTSYDYNRPNVLIPKAIYGIR